jgi:PAS domain S-box-containing protein
VGDAKPQAGRQPVLIVDDDAVSRKILAQAMDKAGFYAEVLASGQEALAWLMSGNQASIVLLDLVMPPPDGYAVLRAMRASAELRETPVVVLTAVDADEEVTRAFDMGADDFVRKPFKTAELIARIRSQLRMRDFVEALERRERDARVVLELTQTLSSTLDFRNILYTVVRRIADVARVDRCSIVLVRDESQVGYVVAASDDRELRDLPIDLSKYPEIRRVLETGEPLFVDDTSTDPVFDLVRSELPATSFRWLACLPITYEEKPLGVLFLRRREPHRARDHELWVARTVANATAIALRNASIMQNLREQTRESTYARFEAERRIRALEPYADFFHASADGIMVLDTEALVLFSNPRAREILGRSEIELSRTTLTQLLVPEHEPKLRAVLADLFGSRPRMKDEQPPTQDLVALVGNERRTLAVNFVVMDAEETALLTFRDVTQDRATEAELTKTKEFLERVIDSSVDAIISADMGGNVLLFNRAAEKVFRYSAAEVVGQISVRDLYPAGVAREVMLLMRGKEYGGNGRLERYQTEVVASDGTRVPVQISAALIVDRGVPIGSVGVMTDLRDRLRMEASLAAAQEELRAREKQALIAELAGAAAHELNQPLTSVLGFAEIIRRRAKDGQPHLREMEALAAEAERMAEIVRKIGKITKYETMAYVGESKIIDLDRSSAGEDSSRNRSTQPPKEP